MPVLPETEPILAARDAAPKRSARPRIALFGIFGVHNLGNECTLQAMLHNLRERVPEAQLYSICYEPDDTSLRHRVAAIPVHSRRVKAAAQARRAGRLARLCRILFRRIPAELAEWFTAIRVLRGTDLVFMTGTGMLTDYSTSATGYPYDVFKWTLAARIARCRVRFVGVGVGPIYSPLSRWFIKSALRRADYRSYRDQLSKRRLAELGLANEQDPVFPDLAFSLPVSLFPARRKSPGGRPVVAVGVMDYRDVHTSSAEEHRAAYSAYLQKTCDFIAWLVEHGYGVRIVQGDARYDQATRARLRALLEGRGLDYARAGILDEDCDSVDELVAQLAKVDFVVSPRFHNLILGLMLDIPTIAISYDPKSDALLEGFGLGQYCQPIFDLSVPRLIEQFVALEARSAGLGPALRDTVSRYRRLLDEQYRMIVKQ